MGMLLILLVVSFTAVITIHVAQRRNEYSYMVDGSTFVQDRTAFGHPKVVNLTDRVYKSALRFLQCCALPNNSYGIVLLDPLVFSWDNLAHRQTVRLDGSISGVVTDLSRLRINYVSVALASTSARIEAVVPQLSISGRYNVSGDMAGTLPIYGSGSYSIILKNVSVVLTVLLQQNSTGFVTMTKFNVDFSPELIEVSLGELLGGGPLGAVIQDFLQESAPQVIGRITPMIQQDLQNIAISAANHRLGTLKKLINFFVTFGNTTGYSC